MMGLMYGWWRRLEEKLDSPSEEDNEPDLAGEEDDG